MSWYTNSILSTGQRMIGCEVVVISGGSGRAMITRRSV